MVFYLTSYLINFRYYFKLNVLLGYKKVEK